MSIFFCPFKKISRDGNLDDFVIPIVQVFIHGPIKLERLLLFFRFAKWRVKPARVISVHSHDFIDITDLAVLRIQDVQRPIGDRKKIVVPLGDLADQPSPKHGGTGSNKIAHPDIFQG